MMDYSPFGFDTSHGRCVVGVRRRPLDMEWEVVVRVSGAEEELVVGPWPNEEIARHHAGKIAEDIRSNTTKTGGE